jgi:phage shock protein PspC (stress-responsive transcriptional regulator)
MNKVITINLNGNAYQLEEGGYELLRAYLDGAARRLEGNPDRDEIIGDIEQAIGDKCRGTLGAYKTVVSAKSIEQIIAEMGPVEDPSASEGGAAEGKGEDAGARRPAGAASSASTEEKCFGARRLYRIRDGAMICGVCNGLAAYLNVDVTLVRVAFVVLSLITGGVVALAYFLLVIFVPPAGTPEEKAAAFGAPFTAQEFIKRAKEGYYEGVRTISDKHAHHEWRRRFRHEMRNWRRTFRHEARESSRHWRYQWWHSAPGTFQPGFGAWFLLPVVTLLRIGLTLAWLYALVSLLAIGSVHGIVPPVGIPLWAALLILMFVYSFVSWPLKAMRHACYYQMAHASQGVPPFFWFGDSIIKVAFLVLLAWAALHHLPLVQQALHNIPTVAHEAIDAIRQWWAKA